MRWYIQGLKRSCVATWDAVNTRWLKTTLLPWYRAVYLGVRSEEVVVM